MGFPLSYLSFQVRRDGLTFLLYQGPLYQVLLMKNWGVDFYLVDSLEDLFQSEEGSQLKAGIDPQWSLNLLSLIKTGWV